MTATDIGDPGPGRKLGFDAIEGGNPGAGQVVQVARSEEAFTTAEDVVVVRTPGESVARPEALGDRVGRIHGSDRDLECADHGGGTGLVGERYRVLVG